MTRVPLAVLLVAALALPVANALAQPATVFDDAQRATVEEYFGKQAEKATAAEKARKAKEVEKAKAAAKTAAKPAAKTKKPKKPEKPKAPQKDKSKAKAKNGNKKKPLQPADKLHLERGQALAQDLPRRALPKDLDAQLGRTASGTQRVIVGDDIVLFERKTGRILDIMEDAVKGVAPGR